MGFISLAGAKRHLHHGNAEPIPQFYPLLLARLPGSWKIGISRSFLGGLVLCSPSPRKSLPTACGLVGGFQLFLQTLEAHVSPEAHCSRLDRDVPRQYRGRRVAARTAWRRRKDDHPAARTRLPIPWLYRPAN